MPEEIKPVVPAVDTKTADAPVVNAGKPAETAPPAVDNKPASVTESKTEPKADVKPAEELKSLLDEAGEEPKLDKDGKPIEAKKTVVPEKYEFKLPEGVTLDEAQLKIVEPLFKELGLDNVQAQKLVDLQLNMNKASEEAHVQAWETHVETQKKETKEYFGTKLPEVMRNVARARDTFMPKDTSGKSQLQEELNVAGFSNNKNFIEFMDRVGRVIGEGKFMQGKMSAPGRGTVGVETPTGKEASLAEVYPSMSKN